MQSDGFEQIRSPQIDLLNLNPQRNAREIERNKRYVVLWIFWRWVLLRGKRKPANMLDCTPTDLTFMKLRFQTLYNEKKYRKSYENEL